MGPRRDAAENAQDLAMASCGTIGLQWGRGVMPRKTEMPQQDDLIERALQWGRGVMPRKTAWRGR